MTEIGGVGVGKPCRSEVPDLLFEDVCAARVQDIRPYLEEPERVDENVRLHRVTVFLTYRCNLDCPYCKTIARSEKELAENPQKRVSFTYEGFRAFLESFDTTPIEHLHFTGGEATMVRDLPRMVRLAMERGVRKMSITSNGTMPVRIYRELVESGMDEIRISIDTSDPALGDVLTGRKGMWARSVRTLRGLAGLRAAGRRFFLIANTVVGRTNRNGVADVVRLLLRAGPPDDIKLITDVDEKESLGNFKEAEAVKACVESLLCDYPPEAFPLLRRKLGTVFSKDAIGLEEAAARVEPGRNWRCYIPLTERTVDGVYYYPCSVYLREGGRPLGKISEPMDEQRRKTAEFVRRGDCLNDPICRRFCLTCTKRFNVVCNGARRGAAD